MLIQLHGRPDLVVAVSQYEHRRRDAVEQFKAIVQLVDGTRFHLSEVWVGGELRKYAYFQLPPMAKSYADGTTHPIILK